MMVRKYIIGENELCAFGDVVKKILDDSLVVSCRTKASDLLRVLKRVKFEGGLEPYVYDVEQGRLEEIRQGNLSTVSDEYNDKGLMIILDENDYILYIDSKVYDVLISKGDVYEHSDEIQSTIYLDPLTGYILYGTTVDASNLLVGYGVLLDMVHGQTEGVVSVAGMYSSNMGYRCFGPVFFPEHANEITGKGHQLTFDKHDSCPFCGGEITLTKHDVEVCKNAQCQGRKIYGIYSLIGEGEIPNVGVKRGLRALINNGYDTVDKIFELSPNKLPPSIVDEDDSQWASEGLDVIFAKVHAYRWKLEHDKSGLKDFLASFTDSGKVPLEGMKLYILNISAFGSVSDELELLGATVEQYCDKITEEHILLGENPETIAEVIDELPDLGIAKTIKTVNIGDCNTGLDIARKLMNPDNFITVSISK